MKSMKNGPAARAFAAYPPAMRRRLMRLRRLILDTAARTQGVGEIEETVKWGEPAFATAKSRSGSTVRIGWKKSRPSQYAIYFNCQTMLVDSFRALFPDDFKYERNRAIVFNKEDTVPARKLAFCIAAALTYHARKKGERP